MTPQSPVSMRIVHLLHSYAPDSAGGIETYVSLLARIQRDAGLEVSVLAGSDAMEPGAPALREERIDGIAVARTRAPTRFPHRVDGLDAAARDTVAAHLRGLRPDVVHVHHWHNLSTDIGAAARRTGAAVVVTLHDLFATCPLFFRLPDDATLCAPELPREECARCIGGRTDTEPGVTAQLLARREATLRDELLAARAVLVLSETQRAYLARVPALVGFDLTVLALPSPSAPAPVTQHAPAGDGRLRLVSWGGLVPGKGLHVLVEACERLAEPARVSIDHYGRVLDPHYAARLREAARRVALTLHGPFDARDGLAAYDLMVMPSLYLETHGFAVDEAMALGLPVLVSDRGAPKERIGGRGLAFPAGDAKALSEILADLLARPERLAAMRAARPRPQPSIAEHHRALLEVYGLAQVR